MYTYAPLRDGDGKHIRVMKLLPGHWESCLECTIDEVDLEDMPEYEALSYTWRSSKFDAPNESIGNSGTSSKTNHALDKQQFIYCHGKGIKIGLSLQNLLKRLRSESEPRTLWADQICIDQGNTQEVGEQVKIMRDIYAGAKWSLLWAGEADATVPGVFKMIQHMAEYIIDPTIREQERLRSIQDEGWRGLEAAAVMHQGLFILEDSKSVYETLSRDENNVLSDIIQFLSRPVFSRIWIVQEICVAKHVLILSGGNVIHWDSFAVGLCMLMTPEFLSFPTPLRIKLRDNCDALSNIFNIKKWRFCYQYFPEFLTFPQLFNSGCIFGATEARDQVYALIGLMNQRGNWIQFVDYAIDNELVFHKFSKHLFSRTQQLDWLDPAGRAIDPSGEARPSWVIDFSKSSNFPSQNLGFTCSGQSKAVLNWQTQGSKTTMQTSAYLLDSIAAVSPLLLDPDQPTHKLSPPILAQTLLDWSNLAAIATAYTSDGLIDAFWRTAFMDTSQLGKYPAPSSCLTLYGEYLEDRFGPLRAARENRGDFDRQPGVAMLRQLIPDAEWAKPEIEKRHLFGKLRRVPVFRHLASSSRKRLDNTSNENPQDKCRDYTYLDNIMKQFRLFVSKRGYIGLCRESAQVGDEIHVMSGCNVPFVLRPSTTSNDAIITAHFTVRGQAYMHGFMAGEALEREDFAWKDTYL